MTYLFDDFPYITKAKQVGFFAKKFPSLAFYPQAFNIVRRAGIIANKGLYTAEEWIKSSQDIARTIENIGGKIIVEGSKEFRENKRPYIFIANHMSTLETFVLPALIQPFCDVTFVVKDSLVKYPYFGSVLLSRDPIVVGRANPREDLTMVLDKGQEILASGRSIIIFPQSTRANSFDEKQFTSIGVKLAKKTGVPIVPVALKTDAWSTGKIIKDLGYMHPERVVHFHFAPTIIIDGAGKEEHKQICNFIAGKLNTWQADVTK